MKKVLVLTILTIFLISGTHANLITDQAPTFISEPEDTSMGVGDSLTLVWELSDANGEQYTIYMNAANHTDSIVDQDTVVDNQFSFELDSLATGSYTFSATITATSLWSNVSITVTGVTVTSSEETTTQDTPFTGWLLFIPIIGLVRRLKIKS